MKRFFPPSFYNPLSLVGAIVFLFNIGLMIFLAIVAMVSKHPKPYADLIIFAGLPVIIFFGLVLIVAGIVLSIVGTVFYLTFGLIKEHKMSCRIYSGDIQGVC